MSCNCQESSSESKQSNLVAWIQPGGAGPANAWYFAMQDGDWPAVKITGARKNRRGAITPIYRRSGRNPSGFLRVGSRSAAPAANTITLEFASKGCGGFMPSELTQCLLDVYQQHICCTQGGDFKRGWSKIDVFSGIDIESDEYSDGTSYNREDDNDLFLRHAAEMRNAFTIYPLNVPEIGASAAFDTGAGVLDVIYANKENCAGSGCGPQLGCADRWYAITNEGTLIYRKDANSAATSVAVTAYVANNIAKLAILGSRIFASYLSGGGTGGFFWANLDDDGDPGAWTQVAIGTFQPRGWLNTSSSLLLYGFNAQNEPLIYEVDGSTGYTQIFNGGGLDDSGIFDMIECGSTRVGVGQSGAIWVSGCQGLWSLAPTTPTAANILAIDAREGGEWWIGTSDGRIYYTTDGAQNWTQKTFPFSGSGNVNDVRWANPSVGYVLHTSNLYVTWDGGRSWETGTADNDRVIVPPDGDTLSVIATPCCANVTEQSNNFLIAGIAASVGALWQGQIYSC